MPLTVLIFSQYSGKMSKHPEVEWTLYAHKTLFPTEGKPNVDQKTFVEICFSEISLRKVWKSEKTQGRPFGPIVGLRTRNV